MSEVILLDKLRSAPVAHNPYYQYYQNSIGKGASSSGIGNIIRSVPSLQRGYGGIVSSRVYYDRDRLGEGIGSFLMSLFRYAKPMLRKGMHQVVDVASKVANDAIEGRNVKDSLKHRTQDKAKELIRKIPEAFSGVINKPSANNVQLSTGSGLKRRRATTSLSGVKKQKLCGAGGSRKKVKKKYPLLRLI